jgi:transposase
MSRLARTVGRWETAILNWHTTGGASNKPTQALNLAIKQIKRVAGAFQNFANYRLRLLLHCGVTWHDNRAANLRRHAPRFIA